MNDVLASVLDILPGLVSFEIWLIKQMQLKCLPQLKPFPMY
jgi:hypothetical protein